MGLYLISYDLRKQRDYEPLWDALAKANASRLLQSVWLVELSAEIGAVRQALSALMDNDDGLAVIELKPGSGWATKSVLPAGNTWLTSHVRAY